MSVREIIQMSILDNVGRLCKSFTYKKDRSVIVIDSWFGQKFADNPRFLFQFLNENKEKLGLTHVVWVTHNQEIRKQLQNMGYECCILGTKESIEWHKKAYYHICNNAPLGVENHTREIDAEYSYRAKRINLWHGTGVIKTFGIASNEYKQKAKKHPILYKIKNQLSSSVPAFRKVYGGTGGWSDSYYITTSESELHKFQKCCPVPRNRFIITGYPRDSFETVRMLPEEEKVMSVLEQYEYFIMYLPTFRSKDSDFNFLEVAEKLKPILKKHKILLIQKAHSADKTDTGCQLEDNVLSVDTEFDINVLMPKITYVMTDYSSVLADALSYGKPVLLYMPDYEEYMKSDRGFSEDAECMLSAGKKFFDIDELIKFIDQNYANPEASKTESYDDVKSRIWGNENKSMGQIWQDIMKQTE